MPVFHCWMLTIDSCERENKKFTLSNDGKNECFILYFSPMRDAWHDSLDVFFHSFIQFQLFGTFFVCGKIFSLQLRDLFCYSFLALTYTIVHRTHICNENTFTIMISARFSPIHDIAIKAYAVHNTRVRVHSYSSLGESNLTEKSTLPNTKTHSR